MGEKGPEGTVDGPQPGAFASMPECRQLLAEGEVLGDEVSTVAEEHHGGGGSQREVVGHPKPMVTTASPRSESPVGRRTE